MGVSIYDIISRLDSEHVRLDIELHQGATEASIAAFESRMGILLPEDFKAFYRFTDGFDTNDDLFRMIPLADIITEQLTGSPYNPSGKGNFNFAEYMIYVEMWAVTIKDPTRNAYSIFDTRHDTTLTDSLAEFLERWLAKGVMEGLSAWGEEVRAAD